MQIQGSFKDIHNNTINVIIYKNSGAQVYNIDDYLDNTHHFCFNGKSPVKITRSCSDLFEPIISATCKIKLLSNIWCGDLLFSEGIGDIIVRVTRTIGSNTELLFVGYVTPLTFSQNINTKNNVIDIVCKDLLGCLEDKYLSTGTTYDNVIASAQFRTFKNILKKIGIFNNTSSTYVFPGTSYNTKLYVDNTVKEYMSLQISDNLWLGDSKDDEMTLKEILLELLKYTNSRIISIDGVSHYMISNNATTSTNSFWFVNTDTTVQLGSTSNTLPQEDKAKEQVTIDDCYNLIGVKCELENVDNVVVSPLEKSDISSPFNNKQLYMTEYVCEQDNNYGKQVWTTSILQDRPISSDVVQSDKLWHRDWYIRYIENKNWTLYNPYTPSTNSQDGTYIKQYESAAIMDDLFQNGMTEASGGDYWNITMTTPLNLYPSLLQVGEGNKRMSTRPDEKSSITMKNVLILPCPETWIYDVNNTPVTESWAYDYINRQLAKYETTPMVQYHSNKNVNFTPTDSSITNYIVFSGKIKLIPSCVYSNRAVPSMGYSYRGLSYGGTKQDLVYENMRTSTFNPQLAIADDKDKKRWYYRVYWTKTTPNQSLKYPTHRYGENSITDYQFYAPVDPDAPRYKAGQIYSLNTDGMYSKQFGWGKTRIDKRNWTVVDMNYVPILMCKLRIGDKYLNEITIENASAPSYEWSSDSDSVFSLSIKPQVPENASDTPTDFLIGQEYSIINTVTDNMNISEAEGLAVPVKYTDNLHGDIEFSIVGPYNAVLDSTNHYYKHSTWFRSSKTWDQQNADICILNHVHSINITDFEVKAYSDNAKNATMNEGDLLYYSEDNKKYNNPKDDIEFKIVTGLTSEEASDLNIATGISYNNPTDDSGHLYLPTTKPEENYIQTMYDLYSTPKKKIEYYSRYGSNKISDIYRTVYECDLMEDLGISDFNSIVIGDQLDLKMDEIKITTRQL